MLEGDIETIKKKLDVLTRSHGTESVTSVEEQIEAKAQELERISEADEQVEEGRRQMLPCLSAERPVAAGKRQEESVAHLAAANEAARNDRRLSEGLYCMLAVCCLLLQPVLQAGPRGHAPGGRWGR